MTALPEEETRLREEAAQLDLDLSRLRAEAEWQAAQPARRERIATAVLTGMLANPNVDPWRDKIAVYAVFHADALIAELDKPKEVQP